MEQATEQNIPQPRGTSRNYSPRTVALLYGLSGNRCAFPDCPNRVIADATAFDDAAVNGNISHIYASSPRGPRPAPDDFDRKALDSFDNLILLCSHHNTMVDKQPNTYTPEMIQKWKAQHLRRSLLSLSSLLPESKSRLSALGLEVTAFTADARLAEVGQIYTKSKTTRAGRSVSVVQETFIPYYFELDNGGLEGIELQNSRLNCAKGSRVSLLFAEIKNGQSQRWLSSIYDHALAQWTPLPRPKKVVFATSRELGLFNIGIASLLFIFILLQLLEGPAVLSLTLLGLTVFYSVIGLGLGFLREQIVRGKLTALQDEIIIS